MTGNWLPDDLWAAAEDSPGRPGVIRINGQPFPLAEFAGCDLPPWQEHVAEVILNHDGPVRPLLRYRDGMPQVREAQDIYDEMAASECHRADTCVLDDACPFAAACREIDAQ